MVTSAVVLLLSGLFMCLAAWSAAKAQRMTEETRALMRDVRSRLAELELQATRAEAGIKRLTSSLGAIGRWTVPKEANPASGDLPDPKENPEEWRKAVVKAGGNKFNKGAH